MKEISPQLAWDTRSEWTFIDIRPIQPDTRIIPDAVVIGLLELGQLKIDQDKPIIVYCARGLSSQMGVQKLEDFGYKDVHNLTGGFTAWDELGLPSKPLFN